MTEVDEFFAEACGTFEAAARAKVTGCNVVQEGGESTADAVVAVDALLARAGVLASAMPEERFSTFKATVVRYRSFLGVMELSASAGDGNTNNDLDIQAYAVTFCEAMAVAQGLVSWLIWGFEPSRNSEVRA